MFQYLLPKKEIFGLAREEYTLYTLFHLTKFLTKNPIYIRDDILYCDDINLVKQGTAHIISKWIYVSLTALPQVEQDLLLLKTDNLKSLFLFITQHERDFEKCLMDVKKVTEDKPAVDDDVTHGLIVGLST